VRRWSLTEEATVCSLVAVDGFERWSRVLEARADGR